MKLYVFRPKGFGEESFFIIADSEKTAFEEVSAFLKKEGSSPFGWGTDRYIVEVYELGGKNWKAARD